MSGTLTIIGERPAGLPAGPVYQAPRPLWGTRVEIDGLSHWAGLVAVTADEPAGFDKCLAENWRLDARRVIWRDRTTAAALYAAYLAKLGYEPDEVASVVAAVSDDILRSELDRLADDLAYFVCATCEGPIPGEPAERVVVRLADGVIDDEFDRCADCAAMRKEQP